MLICLANHRMLDNRACYTFMARSTYIDNSSYSYRNLDRKHCMPFLFAILTTIDRYVTNCHESFMLFDQDSINFKVNSACCGSSRQALHHRLNDLPLTIFQAPTVVSRAEMLFLVSQHSLRYHGMTCHSVVPFIRVAGIGCFALSGIGGIDCSTTTKQCTMQKCRVQSILLWSLGTLRQQRTIGCPKAQILPTCWTQAKHFPTDH